jgi:hypothetical protein
VTGLEPATSGVTGRHSNQLSYTRASRVATVGRDVAVNYEVHRGVSSDPGKGFDVPVNSFLKAAAEARRRNGRGSREPEFSTGDDVGAVNHVTELDSRKASSASLCC